MLQPKRLFASVTLVITFVVALSDVASAQRSFGQNQRSSGGFESSGEGSDYNWLPWLELGLRAADELSRPQYREPYPRYREPYPRYERNDYTPAPQPQPRVTPEANKIVTDVSPLRNDGLQQQLNGMNLARTSSVIQQAQKQEVDNAQKDVEQEISRQADEMLGKINGINAQQKAELDAALNSGDPAKVKQWLDQHGGNVNGDLRDLVEMHHGLGELSRDIDRGFITPQGVADSLNDLDGRVANLPNGPFKNGLGGRIDQMQGLNNLQTIVTAAQNSGHPLLLLTAGVTEAGLPPSLLSEVTGLPIVPLAPVDEADQDAVTEGVYLVNPEDTENEVKYTIDERWSYSMQPGQSQKLPAKEGGYVIAFDRGLSGGIAKYRLDEGTYYFSIGGKGWNVGRKKFTVVIDNSSYGADFNYVANNKRAVVKAGATKTHESDYPVEIEFDRGDGSSGRKLVKGGRLKVGVDATKASLDLFEAEEYEQLAAAQENDFSLAQFSDRGPSSSGSVSGDVSSLLETLRRHNPQGY